MTDTGKPPEESADATTEVESTDVVSAAAEADTSSQPQAPNSDTGHRQPEVIVQKKGGFSAALAIIFSLAALAASAYLWLEIERLDSQAAAPDARLAALADEQRVALAALADDQQARLATLGAEVAALGQRLDEAVAAQPTMPSGAAAEVEDLTARLEMLESARLDNDATLEALTERVALAEASSGADPELLEELNTRLEQAEAAAASAQVTTAPAIPVNTDFALEEVQSYLRIANRQLQLAGNAAAAESALQLADDRLAQLDDPSLTDVRAAIADEIAAVRRIDSPDLTGIALSLSTLAEKTSDLPLKGHSGGAPASAGAAEPVTEPQTGWQRFLASVKAALHGLVAVRRTDTAVEPLLPPEEVYFLYRNVELKLEVARLALLQHNEEIFRTSLRSVRTWINEYFDTGDKGVESVLREIADLEGAEITPTVPDISGSLKLLQQAGRDEDTTTDSV